MDGCPTTAELQALAHDAQASLPAVARHAATCPRCEAGLSEARRDHALFVELRAAVATSALPPDRGALSGSLTGAIPGYGLLAELHRGGQGVVYRALQRSTSRAVAIKVLAVGRDAYRDRLRFEREVDLACRLRHPGIVTIFDRGRAGEHLYYVMELVEGCTLDEHVRRTQPGLDQRLELFGRLCASVAYAHRRGVIHRDLKPSNVLVDERGLPRVLDFGVAHALDASSTRELRVTRAGEFTGTLGYASPEQVSGDVEAVDTRTDVYSLGVVLYELLTGRLPHDTRGSLPEVISRIAGQPPTDPAELGVRLDRDLGAILAHTLAKDPARRYGSVDALAQDIAHRLAGEAPVGCWGGRGRSAWYELRRLVVRHRLALLGALALLVVGGLGLAGVLRERLETRRQREQAALVGEVFRDVLAAAAPQRMGADVRLVELFEQVSTRIEGALGNAPDVQAAIHGTLGETYASLLRFEEAEPHARRAVERCRALGEDSAVELADALELLGAVLSRLNRPEAVAVQEEALALRLDALGPRSPEVARSRRAVAVALLAQWELEPGDRERALASLEAARADLERALGPDDPEVAETLYWLERAGGGDDEQRAGLLRRALAIFERRDTADPRAIDCLNRYAEVLQHGGEFDQADGVLARSVVLTTRLYGDERAAEMLRRQAALEHARGAPRNAEELTREAFARELEQAARSGSGEPGELRALAARLGGPDGTPPYAAALAALRGYRGEGAFELAEWGHELTALLRELGRADECEPILRESLKVGCRAFGADCPIRQDTLALLAELLIEQRREPEARPLLEETLATSERLGQGASHRAGRARELLACCDGPGR